MSAFTTSRLKLPAFAAVAVLSVALSGCVTLLPKTQPVQLYRFAYTPDVIDKQALPDLTAQAAPIAVGIGAVEFPQDASGDRIVTMEGNEVAYAAGSRWAAPAEALFNEEIGDGFARSASSVRLEPRGIGNADYRLDVVVRRFEADYSHNKPTVTVDLDARVTRVADHMVVGERYITADIGVGRSDMSMMVDAYDKATTQAIAGLIGFTQDSIANAPPVAVTPAP